MEEKRTYYERILPPPTDRAARLEAMKRRRDELVSRSVNRGEQTDLLEEIRWLNREILALAAR